MSCLDYVIIDVLKSHFHKILVKKSQAEVASLMSTAKRVCLISYFRLDAITFLLYRYTLYNVLIDYYWSQLIKLKAWNFKHQNFLFSFLTITLIEGSYKSWPEWNLNRRPLNSVQILQPTEQSGHDFNSH